MPPLEGPDPYQGEGEGDQEVCGYKIARIQDYQRNKNSLCIL